MAKKKIKDLTLEEIMNICKNHRHCVNCPLVNNNRCVPSNIFVRVEDLEQEIDVEETPSKIKDLRGCC